MTTAETLPFGGATFALREATADDLPGIVELLAADQLRLSRDGISNEEDLKPYLEAFRTIDADPTHLLLVVVDGTEVVGTMQLSFLPGLARRGAMRAHIEAVRVRRDLRNQQLGTGMFTWAIAEARRRGCGLVQLTTDKSRVEAHRFYERLGFTSSHEGLKLRL